nr:plasmid mobilization protein MobA [Escherichia coli]
MNRLKKYYSPCEVSLKLRLQPEAVDNSVYTVSAYIRNAALNKRINSRTDDAFLKELMRLGRMQKHLFVQGKRTGDKEYAEVLVAITELTNTLRKQLMEG